MRQWGRCGVVVSTLEEESSIIPVGNNTVVRIMHRKRCILLVFAAFHFLREGITNANKKIISLFELARQLTEGTTARWRPRKAMHISYT